MYETQTDLEGSISEYQPTIVAFTFFFFLRFEKKKKKMKKIFLLLAVFLFSAFAFDLFHYIDKNKNGILTVEEIKHHMHCKKKKKKRTAGPFLKLL